MFVIYDLGLHVILFALVCAVIVMQRRYQRFVLKTFESYARSLERHGLPVIPPSAGVTLAPRQSAMADVELPLHVAELLAKGGQLTYREGKIVQEGAGRFHRDVHLAVDGQPQGSIRVCWTGECADLQVRLEHSVRGTGLVN